MTDQGLLVVDDLFDNAREADLEVLKPYKLSVQSGGVVCLLTASWMGPSENWLEAFGPFRWPPNDEGVCVLAEIDLKSIEPKLLDYLSCKELSQPITLNLKLEGLLLVCLLRGLSVVSHAHVLAACLGECNDLVYQLG